MSIDPKHVFGLDIGNYAQARLDYPLEFVQEVLDQVVSPTQRKFSGKRPVALDVGAGTGKLGRELITLGFDVIFLEPNAKSVAHLKSELGNSPHAQILQASANDTGLPDQSVDVVVMGDASHWISRNDLPELSRIIKPGGKMVSFSRFWSQHSALTEKVHELLMSACEEYPGSTNQLWRDRLNFTQRLGHHLLPEEDNFIRGYSFRKDYTKDDLVNYFKSVSSTVYAINRDEAGFRQKVIEPLWQFAKENDYLEGDKLKVAYQVNGVYGPLRTQQVRISQRNAVSTGVAAAVG